MSDNLSGRALPAYAAALTALDTIPTDQPDALVHVLDNWRTNHLDRIEREHLFEHRPEVAHLLLTARTTLSHATRDDAHDWRHHPHSITALTSLLGQIVTRLGQIQVTVAEHIDDSEDDQ